MNRISILEIIADQRSKHKPGRLIERECLKAVLSAKQNRFIQVFSGVRRCGKSTLLEFIRQKNEEKDYYMNFDDERLIGFGVEDFQKLHELFIEKFGEQKTFYFDEIQNVSGWEKFIRRLHDEGNKIYITGSNANLLSCELGTRLTGRYLQMELFPFSFREFLDFRGIDIPIDPDFLDTPKKIKLKKSFLDYLKNGGLPEFLASQNTDYLKQLYEGILYKDIVVRYRLPQEKAIKELALYCASNIAKPVSFNSLKTLLGVGSATTIKEYLAYFGNSYLFFQVAQYHYSLKKQIYAPKKIYCVDNRLSREIGFHFSDDHGRLLENVVFLELKRRRKILYYHFGAKECDFVIRNGKNITEAIQVSVDLENPDTKKREIEGLAEAMSRYQLKTGLLLTENEEGSETIVVNQKKCRIHIMPVWKWML